MPIFVATIFEPNDAPRDPSAPNFLEYMAGYRAFGELAADAIVGGAALDAPSTGTTLQVIGGENGDVVLSDGPFAETKEFLGGFYLLECEDVDAAIALARHIPAAWRDGGRVEVRLATQM